MAILRGLINSPAGIKYLSSTANPNFPTEKNAALLAAYRHDYSNPLCCYYPQARPALQESKPD